MHTAHVRAFVARRPRLRRVLVGALALAAGGLVASRAMAADRAADAWGERRIVWVAAHDHLRGAELAARPVEAPVGLLPDRILVELPDDAIATHDLVAGEMLTTGDVITPAELLADGRRGVAVPADETTLPVRIGDVVDVVALGRVLATGGVVTEIGPAVVVVAVEAGDAAGVAAAATDRTAGLVRVGG